MLSAVRITLLLALAHKLQVRCNFLVKAVNYAAGGPVGGVGVRGRCIQRQYVTQKLALVQEQFQTLYRPFLTNYFSRLIV